MADSLADTPRAPSACPSLPAARRAVLMLGILFGNQVVARVVRPFAYPWNGMMPREM